MLNRCSNLAALDHDCTRDGLEFTVMHLTKTRSARHPGPPKKVFYSSFPDSSEVYPVAALHLYIQKTAEQVISLGTLFIISQKPIHRTRSGTISHWIKDSLA